MEVPKDASLSWHHDFGTVYMRREVDSKFVKIPVRFIFVLARLDESSDERTVIALVSSDLTQSAKWLAKFYEKRWRIEVFYRHMKQNLSLGKCHSPQKNASFAHTSLAFVADLVLRLVAQPANSNLQHIEPSGLWMDRLVHLNCHWDRREINQKIFFEQTRFSSITQRVESLRSVASKLQLWVS